MSTTPGTSRPVPSDDASRSQIPITRRQFGAAAAATVLGALGLGSTQLGGGTTPADAASSSASSASRAATRRTVSRTAVAAAAFARTLSAAQRKTLIHEYEDETKTTSWSNFPVTFVTRAGLNLKDLSSAQRAAAMRVLRALLNETGYETVTEIMDGASSCTSGAARRRRRSGSTTSPSSGPRRRPVRGSCSSAATTWASTRR